MAEAADFTHAVLARLTQFVRGLSSEQLADLASGRSGVQLVPPATSEAAEAPSRRPQDMPIAVDEIREKLASLPDRASAVRYLDGLRLTVAQLRSLAKALNLAVSASAPKAQVRDTIVQWTVGRRVDSAVLGRPAAPRSTD